MLSILILNVIVAECHFAEYSYTEVIIAECHYALYTYTEHHYC